MTTYISCIFIKMSPLFFQKKNNVLKEKIKKKYEDMKRVLDEDLRITLNQLDMESEATERTIEDKMERCYHLAQELDQDLAQLTAQGEKYKQHVYDKVCLKGQNSNC